MPTKSTDFSANLKWADPDYFNTFDLRFVAGRPYSPSDTVRDFVVNETLLKKLGVRNPQDAIGKQISFWDGRMVGQYRRRRARLQCQFPAPTAGTGCNEHLETRLSDHQYQNKTGN